jgi:hypothetical protein
MREENGGQAHEKDGAEDQSPVVSQHDRSAT